jgi:hypothetical protein
MHGFAKEIRIRRRLKPNRIPLKNPLREEENIEYWKSTIFRYRTPYTPIEIDWLIACLTLQPLSQNVPPKSRSTTALHGVTSEKIALFIVTDVKASNPTEFSISDGALTVELKTAYKRS